MPYHPRKKRVVFSVTNCICYDQRVLKMAETVGKLDCDIIIIGRITSGCCKKELIPFRTKRFRMIFKRGFLFYKFFNIRLFIYLLFHKCDILVSNDLDTLLPNFIVSRLKGLPLVYDSHEYFTGVPELQNRPIVTWIWKSIEKTIFPKLKHVMTVSDPIASLYEKLYSVRPLVVRNFSRSTDHIVPFSREELGINNGDLLLIIQGTGINMGRGAEELLGAIKVLKNVSLLIVGSGDVLDELKNQVNEPDIGNRVKFIHRLPWEELMRYTLSADIGVTLDKNFNDNYRFSLPNKLFDYISAGIPVMASDLPEVKKIVAENDCGIIIDEVTIEKISAAIISLRDDRQKLERLKKNAVSASEVIRWGAESEKVMTLYKGILDGLTKGKNSLEYS
jgi:glycosyltransferase involved in cell wall biosynthesis